MTRLTRPKTAIADRQTSPSPKSRELTQSLNVCSEGVTLAQYFEERLDQDLKVEPKAPVIDVPQVEFDTFLNLLNLGRCASRTVALRPTRNPGLHMVAERIIT